MLNPEEYDEQVFDDCEKVAVINSKKGDHMNHYDYVLCPDGKKKKIYSREDIEQLLKEWEEYCDNNWLNGGKAIFDPESKVKFMLDGLANILLRNHMDGVLTEYKKMKIGKYEIPISVCASMFGNELYSEREKMDNGEGRTRMEAIMEEAARKFDEARLAKNSKKRQAEIAMKKPKTFPPTRRQKIEKAREVYAVQKFAEAIVDADNVFKIGNDYYRIPSSCQAYAPKQTRDGDLIYDMDKILCGETISGDKVFFDMNIELVEGVELIGEQMRFA